MSRDFRPIELYAADRKMGYRNMKITYEVNGEETEITHGTEESRRLYPEMNFLLSDYIDRILADIPGEILKECEACIEEAEEEFLPDEAPSENGAYRMHGSFFEEEEAQSIISSIDNGDVRDMKATVRAWFLGQLDPGFYYKEENENKLMEYLYNCKARSREKEKDKPVKKHSRGR